jgi:hypothetical protein
VLLLLLLLLIWLLEWKDWMEEAGWGECWDNTRTGVFPFMACVLEIEGAIEIVVEWRDLQGKAAEVVAEVEVEVEGNE